MRWSLSLSLIFHPQLLNAQSHLAPMQATDNSHHSNGLPQRHVGSSRAEGWMRDKSGGREGATAGSQTGGNRRGRGRREEEERGQTHPLEVLSSHPSCLGSTLRHIVQQLDILTQVSCKLSTENTGRKIWKHGRRANRLLVKVNNSQSEGFYSSVGSHLPSQMSLMQDLDCNLIYFSKRESRSKQVINPTLSNFQHLSLSQIKT